MSKLRITDCPTNDICELYLKLAEQIEAYKQADHEASEIIAELKHENEVLKDTCNAWGYTSTQHIEKIERYKQALEEIRNITEKLITELPEYNSCYYKDECGDNCTPKKQSKVEYCCYENVDKILTIINEALND